jgi:ribonuclease G
MSKELVISTNRHETKVALIEDDQLVEVYFQRSNEYSLAGSIHKGRVTRVLPGMQSAFVDLGLERDTFLYVSDFLEEHEDFDRVTGDERPLRRDDRPPRHQERRPAAPPPEQQPAPAAAEAPVEAPAATAAAVVAPPPAHEPRGGEPRERRGRRSRRRRGGRGFPESKYAEAAPPSAESVVPRPLETAEIEPEPDHAASESIAVPIILPGESLAKYRHAAPPPTAAPLPAAKLAEETEYDEPLHYPPENALPDAPRHIATAESASDEATVVPAPIAEEPPAFVEPTFVGPAFIEPVFVEPAPVEPAPVEQAIVEPARVEPARVEPVRTESSVAEPPEEMDEIEPEDEAGPAVAPLLDEEEDLDIQAMILGEVEGIEIEPADEGSKSEEGAEPGEAAAQSETGAASVREQGGRYPHRVSRRTRRRGRGGQDGRQNGRPEGRSPDSRGPEGRPESGSETRPEPRSETQRDQERTVSRPGTSRPGSSRPNEGQPSISDLLKEGQEIIVQIAKEPLGQKGARITSHIALPGRYVVYMPTLEHMGVSRKIGSDDERLRLKRILLGKRPGPTGGFITRTAAEGRTEDEIASDMLFLYNLWQDIKTKAEKRPAPLLLHHDLDIVQRILRDQLADSFKAIWIDSEDAYESVLRFVERFQPALVGKVKLYTREAPIFDAFNVTSELEKALRPKVWLKSGGYIVINQTEALVAVDVNTGKYVGKSNRLEDTIVKTNTEAIKEIVRQIRLRDLGGIIVIDFIDMDERKNRQKVMQTLEEAMRVDRAPYKILQFNDFGLVAITRKRVKQSLERTLCSLCPHCEGAGYIKSAQTVVSEILTEARKLAKSVEGKDVMLRVHPDVAKLLKSHQNKYLEELEEVMRRPVLVKSDPQLHHEKFDLA